MLPELRQELSLYPGARTLSGAPTWSLHDPTRNAFFRIDWLTFEILARWGLDDPQAIVDAVGRETPIQAELEDIEAVLSFLGDNELVRIVGPMGTDRLRQQAARRRKGPLSWALHHYLFFRIPLWRPDGWLERALPWVAPLSSRTFRWLTLAALLVGLVETSRQWEVFVARLVDTVSPRGLAGFFVALVFVKLMHELGHAFTAKRYGCRVPTMGVAFLVLFPMAYTDVNDVWKLPDRRQRFAVGAAGIRTELVIAAWATLAWALLPEGMLRGFAFMMATTTWISTVLINASPFMRFDGYFMLMDWLEVPNLHQRAFALARWRLRKALFGDVAPPPEVLPLRRRRGLIAFAVATWIYRLTVFTGIAVLVYSVMPKPLGPLLAFIEIWWFIALPVWSEIRHWGACLAVTRATRLAALAAVVCLVAIAAAAPLDPRVSGQAIMRPSSYFTLFVPEPVRVVALPVAAGTQVVRGQTVLEAESPEIRLDQSLKEVQELTMGWQSAAAGVDDELLGRIGVIEASRSQLNAELAGLRARQERFLVRAPGDGTLFLPDLDLQPGDWVGRAEPVAVVTDVSAWQTVTYLPETEVARITVGAEGYFYPEHSALRRLPVRVAAVDADAARLLPDAILAAPHGGRILARETAAGWSPIQRSTAWSWRFWPRRRPQVSRWSVAAAWSFRENAAPCWAT